MVTRRAYGTGEVTLTALPVETQLTGDPGASHSAESEPWHALYRLLTATTPRPVDSESPDLAITLHGDRYAVLVNRGAVPAVARFAADLGPVRWLHGSATVEGHHAAVVEFLRSQP